MLRMQRLGVVQPANESFQGAGAARRPGIRYAWRVEREPGSNGEKGVA